MAEKMKKHKHCGARGVCPNEEKKTIHTGKDIRLPVQVLFTIITNGYVKGFIDGKIYQGKLKSVCVPGLNCYSCPGAFGACPLGSLQASLADRNLHIPFFVTGFLFFVGALFGRIVCGWLCPFGLVQDLLYKVPFPGKRKRLPFHHVLKNMKYAVLLFFVLLFPVFLRGEYGVGVPWFCKYICPSGTLLGAVPLMLGNEGLRAAAGLLFRWKMAVLAAVIAISMLVCRPFCQYLCPLGAVYGFFNKISLIHLNLDRESCIRCGKCQKACPVDIRTFEVPDSAECIRCGKCVKACPVNAVTWSAGQSR